MYNLSHIFSILQIIQKSFFLYRKKYDRERAEKENTARRVSTKF
jgi:hypothetical protein